MLRKLKQKEQLEVDIFNHNKTSTIYIVNYTAHFLQNLFCIQMILDIMSYNEPSHMANGMGLPRQLSHLRPPTYAEKVHLTNMQKIQEIHRNSI